MIKDKSIRSVHTNVASIFYDSEDNARAYDADGNEVVLDTAAVSSKVAELEIEKSWSDLRKKRNQLLAESDWMANSDVTMSDAWRTYRQALRDLPANTTDPANPVWPTPPS